jgi:hypothetical protein
MDNRETIKNPVMWALQQKGRLSTQEAQGKDSPHKKITYSPSLLREHRQNSHIDHITNKDNGAKDLNLNSPFLSNVKSNLDPLDALLINEAAPTSNKSGTNKASIKFGGALPQVPKDYQVKGEEPMPNANINEEYCSTQPTFALQFPLSSTRRKISSMTQDQKHKQVL